MALEITAAGDAKLRISGTATELASIYSRLTFSFNYDGSNSGATLYNYSSKTEYEALPNDLLSVNGFSSYISFLIDTATEEQSLETGHAKVKADLEAQGYTVVIVDLPG